MRARVTLLACDSALAEGCPWSYEAWDEFVMPNKIKGGGGTSFVPVFDWAKRQDRQPELLVYFTDAEGEFPAHEPACPTIWLVKGKAKVPWGQRIQLICISSMDLSAEDSLRLNVLLNQDLQAVRIDDSKMIVYGLTEKGEAKVPLNPNCRDEQYIKRVKEVISSHVLGSPGGYPIFLRRWTRMGQTRDESLDRLLQLGEPEAVVAVVHAPGLTDEQIDLVKQQNQHPNTKNYNFIIQFCEQEGLALVLLTQLKY